MQGQGGETTTSLTQPESILKSSLHPERARGMRPLVVGFRRSWAGAESWVPGSPQGAPCSTATIWKVLLLEQRVVQTVSLFLGPGPREKR